MNQQIAQQDRWSRPQILSRAEALAERIASVWPGPVKADQTAQSGIPWDLMDRALAELPAGSWTTYGDVAALIGSHAVPVGMRLANYPVPNAHRVLQVEGTVSPNFRWLEPDRKDDPRDLLRQEGVSFDNHGRANPNQRITVEELAQLAGLTSDELALPVADPSPGQDAELRDQFIAQLSTLQSAATVHGVLATLDAWTGLGGSLEYGTAGETSCFLIARRKAHAMGSIWPVTLYPSGKCEVVFQYLCTRAPFDDVELREQFRQRLNQIPSVDLPSAKLELRPGFDLTVLASMAARDLFIEHLTWFGQHVAEKAVSST